MCQYSSADQEITYQLPQILANYLQKIMSIQIDSSTSQSPPLHTIMSKKAMGRSPSFYRQCQFFGSKPRSAYLKSGLFDFFFQSEQYFSFTTFQPEQYFSATFSQVSASRTGPKCSIEISQKPLQTMLHSSYVAAAEFTVKPSFLVISTTFIQSDSTINRLPPMC